MSKNMLDVSSIKRLCSELKDCPLEFLDLSKNQIDKKSITYIYKLVDECDSL